MKDLNYETAVLNPVAETRNRICKGDLLPLAAEKDGRCRNRKKPFAQSQGMAEVQLLCWKRQNSTPPDAIVRRGNNTDQNNRG